MGAAKKLIDKKVLRDLVPINALSAIHIEEVTKKAAIEEVRAGRNVFKKGDRDYQTVYLLEGTIELVGDDRKVVSTINAGSEAARHPLAHKQPRQLTARATSKVTVARIDSSLLDVLLTWDESAGYDVVEIDAHEDDDWMTRMLQSQAFLQLPPSNIHQLLMRLESVSVKAGDSVVRQGEDGDYFYIVKSGRLAVTRKASARGKEVLLAELGEGACFGEEALVSGTKRNASVMMITDGTLMRLSKDDFGELLCGPLVHEVNFSRAQELVAGGARWLDVRLPGEFDNQAIKGSDNLPLSALRDQCADLDSSTTYVVCCDTGRRSAAGAFVMSQRGFAVFTLKNGLMDVPDEALTRGAADSEAANEAQDAEIIPFDSDTKPQDEAVRINDAEPARQESDDALLIDKLAAAENDKAALQQQLDAAEKQLVEALAQLQDTQAGAKAQQSDSEQARQEIDSLRAAVDKHQRQLEAARREGEQDRSRLQADLEAARHDLESGQRRFESLDGEKQALQHELSRLQQTLSQLQESADGRDDALRGELEQMASRLAQQQQDHDRQTRDLELEIRKVRDDYQQLGQRTSAVAGERDAAHKALEDVREELQALQEKHSAQRDDTSQQQAELEQNLKDRDRELEEAKSQYRALEQQVSELSADRQRLQQQIESSAEQSAESHSRTESLEAEVAQHAQKATELESLLAQAGEREQALQAQLQEIEQSRSRSSGENEALAQQVDAIQQQFDAQTGQLQEQQSRREELERKLAESERALQRATDREQQAAQKFEQGETDSGRLQQELDQLRADADGLRTQLREAREQNTGAERKVADLEAKLSGLGKEHASDIASVREALSRAQDERDNVQREQTRLMESLRKTESDLERERHDHDTEVRRLQKELKETAGESNAGLAAELEAMQQQLRDSNAQREELELQLGERSAQLENEQAELSRLRQQLQQAQDSAREAEQQLIEANQAANEEMTVRLEAEQRVQQSLRDERDAVAAERDARQEQLTVLNVELEELRSAVQQAREDAAASQATAEQLQELQGTVAELERERDAAVDLRQQAQQEIDQLRAEAEVTRGLVEMQTASPAADEALQEELEQVRKNVEIAVRLRTQAEQQASDLQQEVEQLRAQLGRDATDHGDQVQSARIPSLDEDDPQATALFEPEYAPVETPPRAAEQSGVLFEDDEQPASPAPAVAESSGSRKGLVALVLIAVVAVAGGYWWFSQQKSGGASVAHAPTTQTGTEEQTAAPAPEASAEAVEAGQPEPQAAASGADVRAKKDTARKKAIPAIAKGMSAEPVVSSKPPPAEKTDTLPEPKTVAPPEEGVVAKPEKQQAQATESEPQPLRSFRDSLSQGGRGPEMVEFRADSFAMGSGSTSPSFEERPRHSVELKRFAIGKYEVTFEQYDEFARATGRGRPRAAGWGRGKRPVINIRWKDAVAYTRWLSEQTGARYRLPTEAEWEFAARSGSQKRFWWGNEVGEARANCFDCGAEWSGNRTAPVGSFAASPFAVHDMAGNVMEWVQDCYRSGYADAPTDGSAVEIDGCAQRVVRGGGFDSPSGSLRSAKRDKRAPDTRLNNLGFRVVREF